MQNLFFLGIILVGKEKLKTKTQKPYKKTKKKNQSITFCCGDCRNKHGDGQSGADGKGPEGFEGSLQGTTGKNHKRKRKRAGWVPNCSLRSKRKGGSGVFCS